MPPQSHSHLSPQSDYSLLSSLDALSLSSALSKVDSRAGTSSASLSDRRSSQDDYEVISHPSSGRHTTLNVHLNMEETSSLATKTPTGSTGFAASDSAAPAGKSKYARRRERLRARKDADLPEGSTSSEISSQVTGHTESSASAVFVQSRVPVSPKPASVSVPPPKASPSKLAEVLARSDKDPERLSKSASRRARKWALKQAQAANKGGILASGSSSGASGLGGSSRFGGVASNNFLSVPSSHVAPSLSLDSSLDDTSGKGKTRRSRRGGKQNKQRAERLSETRDSSEADSVLDTDDTASVTTTGTTSRSRTPTGSSANSGRRRVLAWDDEDEDDSEDDEGGRATPVAQRRTAPSVLSASDASSSINSFLTDPRNFMMLKENKLRLWQSLCIEFGLVNLEEDLPDLPVRNTPQRPVQRPRADTASSSSTITSSSTATELPVYPLPRTLNQARRILKEHAHVNLVDYFEARKVGAPAFVGAYKDLLWPTPSALRRYTRGEGKFAVKDAVKDEWLNPLMRDILHFSAGKK
ncbi:hypothetical protein L198_01390 [Cryptococcus wingfieldii CBS 7118]|uniref:Uncharacterized protein n=1 Tax=Cryptococcus wingfieldii CBS 7118 TaxID=1295528 RepID=A0A1E3JZ52_9TREE|nr:hypothetical protein L198_01390 [Cryptococcus wingfieldii CBS 7118]ODO06158.1 hypothetical protein L198_01390 [Cryptococcus wingfieldii CBS 7118]